MPQAPSAPAIAHDRQVPVQAVAQQTPCSQNPVTHSAAAAQAMPVGFLPQAPLTQTFGATQSASPVQEILQALVPQEYAPHDWVVVGWQVPVPLQVRAGVKVEPVQLAATQALPLAYSRQAPPPSQNPSVPQPAAPLSAHWPRGSAPAATSVQVPAVPARAQDRQAPRHPLAQQTPCSQKPEPHSVAAAQAVPAAFFLHVPPIQKLSVTHCALVVQVVGQVPPVPHRNGEQERIGAIPQVPVPSQRRVPDSVVPLQVAAPQMVPDA